ncbi:HypC/HybG/HupF family hydrogenase formation chaperone [Marinobacterium weihaiense]|uniref:HypC/HybG/HupF family hydrogenase formation chaperone n=1 Tax=Marinobacterium weihaiense TaxID=2851016 RepID=A0ABS6M7L3_9GAMM|nr:HypC/HybG/HupF family hydrogenase formation chaperone [Marinobacterium weihaiense]MBV0931894.1 HypC/HybG/HupF family hydrogenase formation chaperone [Marinobacterium weihaiense]
MCLGIPAEIVAVDPSDPMSATVEVSGVRRRVNLACVLAEDTDPHDLLGQWVLIHVGFAMALMDADAAKATLALLSELSQEHGSA